MATAPVYSSSLACHHPMECACFIQGINKVLCIECHPFYVGQCSHCYQWFLRASLSGKNSAEWKCEECLTPPAPSSEKEEIPGLLLVVLALLVGIFLQYLAQLYVNSQ
jgi:hypothetical protein